MPKLHGKKVLEAIMKNNSAAKVIVLSAYDDNQGQAVINELIKL